MYHKIWTKLKTMMRTIMRKTIDNFDNEYKNYVQECEFTIDFLGLYQDHYFLIKINVFSK